MKLVSYLFPIVLAFAGCTKDAETLSPDPFYPEQATFEAPLFVEVFTVDGLAVRNAKVNLGAAEGYTDTGGLVYFDNATVGESAYLTVEKEGYFHASRRFYPAPGQAQYLRIILLSDSRIAFFNTKDGAVLEVEDKASIKFPTGGYVLQDGKAYEGIVVVSAKVISADDPELSFKMPGDLVGVNADGNLGALGSLGMMAVEMNTPSGEKVEFAQGTDAVIEMLIPSSMAAKAPSAVPLWYFDEYAGVWKEEGMAIRSGDRYIGSVRHFSFWNCDAWFETIAFDASFAFEDGSPASRVKVCITIENLGASSCAYTNENGAVGGMVAANELLELKVYGKCGQEIYSAEIGPYSGDHNLGLIPVSEPTLLSHVSGIALDCNLQPLTNGYVKISTGAVTEFVVPDISTGAFEAIVNSCGAGNISVMAFNNEEITYSVPVSFPADAEIYVDTLYACSQLDGEYALVEVEGFPNLFLFDDLSFFEENGEGYTRISSDSVDVGSFHIWFRGSEPGVYNVESSDILIKLGVDYYGFSYSVHVEVDEYGAVGGYVKGRVTGTLYTSQNINDPHFPFEASFSVLRD